MPECPKGALAAGAGAPDFYDDFLSPSENATHSH